MKDIVGYIDFAAFAVLANFLGYWGLLYWSDQFGYADNQQVKAKLQQFRFFNKPFTNPLVAATVAIAIVLLNVVAYWGD